MKVVDKTAPSVPTVNKINSKTTTASGKGEKAATVLIYNGSKKIGQGTVDSKGHYNVKIKAQKKGSSLKMYAKDKAGNKSRIKTVKVN
ncbi:Ig-like domain-containing protein [Planomicrobium sp. CPCC 101079]|uniref:Ig-like domain-containing protein n=1 Tax=Planomicrobium sp. CPCC 101079 TaxID=2599618 RepID=UPI00210569B1|nr:Ig-like domain-containing protein [Planomicrobium sp. CPCC 101079]